MSSEPLLVPNVRRIAVLRGGGIGDLVFALPALDAVRAAYPAAHVTLLGKSWQAGLLRNRPAPVDLVVPLPDGLPSDGSHALPDAERRRVVDGLARVGFDVALQVHGGGRHSNPLVRALGARVTAGARTADAEPLDRTIPYIYYQPEVFRDLEIVGLVGARPVGFEPRLAVAPDDRAALARAVPELVHDPRPFAVLHPGAGDPRRRWPARSFAALGDRLAAGGLRVIVTGTSEERALVRAVVGSLRRPALDLAGRLDLPMLMALVERAAVVVANDSGPLHLAAAVGAPTVGIYWCGNVINAGPTFRARHRIAISWRIDCPRCGVDCTQGRCEHGDSFVADVPVDEVAEAAVELAAAGARIRPIPTTGRPAAAPARVARPGS